MANAIWLKSTSGSQAKKQQAYAQEQQDWFAYSRHHHRQNFGCLVHLETAGDQVHPPTVQEKVLTCVPTKGRSSPEPKELTMYKKAYQQLPHYIIL